MEQPVELVKKRLEYFNVHPGYNWEFGIPLSHSLLDAFNTCERAYSIEVLQGKRVNRSNAHTAFGHAVAAGIQQLFAGESLEEAVLAAYLGYDHNAFDEDLIQKGKHLFLAANAVEVFYKKEFTRLLKDWEVAYFVDSHGNSRSGIEFSFLIKLQDASYQGHVDIILRHKEDRTRYKIVEIKSSAKYEEEYYRNSPQTVGYSLTVDYLLHKEGLTAQDYEVLYAVYDSTAMEFYYLPLKIPLMQKADFLLSIELDKQRIIKAMAMEFFPKRYKSCKLFGRTCNQYGICDLTSMQFNLKTFQETIGVVAHLAYKNTSIEDFSIVIEIDKLVSVQHSLITEEESTVIQESISKVDFNMAAKDLRHQSVIHNKIDFGALDDLLKDIKF